MDEHTPSMLDAALALGGVEDGATNTAPAPQEAPGTAQAQKTVDITPLEPEAPPIDDGQAPDYSQLPQDRAAEESLIGSVFFDPACFDLSKVKALIPTDFVHDQHRWIWAAWQHQHERGEVLDDLVTLKAELEKMGNPLDDFYLTGLRVHEVTALNAERYAEIVKDKSRRRDLITLYGSLASAAYNPNRPVDAIITRMAEAAQEAITQPDHPRFVIHSAIEAMQPHPARQEIVKGLIAVKQLGFFFGEPGAKKSYSLMTLALAVAAGLPWLDFETQQCRVFWIDEDTGEDGTRDRVAECMRGLLIEDAPHFEFMSMAGLQLDQDEDAAKLEKIIQDGLYSLVILDCFSNVMSGDENSKKDTAPVMRNLRRLCDRTEAAILGVHHAGKSGLYRGSSAIKAALDLLVRVTSKEGDKIISFQTEKTRYTAARNWASRVTWAAGQFYLTACDAKENGPAPMSKSQEYVLGYLAEHPDASMDEIEGGADTCSPNAARLAVYNLAGLGKIERTNPSNSRRIMSKWQLVKAPGNV